MAIAFFDFDKTLISTSSGPLWVQRELKEGHISPWQALRAAAWLARYSLGLRGDDEDVLERAVATLAGSEEQALKRRTIDFYETQVRSLYRPGALKAIEEHRQAGDRLVLLTSTSLYLSELVAKDVHLDDVLCNRFEVDAQGRYTGKIIGGSCFGEGKLTHARAFADRVGMRLSNATFYTDSYLDLPVLEAVGRPVAVNPDRRLRNEAIRRRWQLVDWGVPSPSLHADGFPREGQSS